MRQKAPALSPPMASLQGSDRSQECFRETSCSFSPLPPSHQEAAPAPLTRGSGRPSHQLESLCPPNRSGQHTRILGNLRESQGLLAGEPTQGLRGQGADC